MYRHLLEFPCIFYCQNPRRAMHSVMKLDLFSLHIGFTTFETAFYTHVGPELLPRDYFFCLIRTERIQRISTWRIF